MTMGINHKTAPELRVPYWIDGDGNERAALTYIDALTREDPRGFQDVHEEAAKHFSERGVAELAAIVININRWTRLKLALGATPKLE